MGDDVNQDGGVDDQEQQTSKPHKQEGVIAFKLQEVGWTQPDTLIVERKYNGFFILRSILVTSFKFKNKFNESSVFSTLNIVWKALRHLPLETILKPV